MGVGGKVKFESGSVCGHEHISLITCWGNGGEILHLGMGMVPCYQRASVTQVVHSTVRGRGEEGGMGYGANIQVCRGEAERKFRESVKIFREKSGNSPYRRLVHIQCL